MWKRSASFILDKKVQFLPSVDAMESDALQNPNPSLGISAYYQTRAEHHAIVTSDWLAQAQAAVTRTSTQPEVSSNLAVTGGNETFIGGKPFSLIDEFNYWRKKPDLAEAVAAIMALAAFIRSSEATTMMELEIELKKASDALKEGMLQHLQLISLERRK